MATEVDLQRLVVQMEASFVKYQREWQKALGTTDTNVKQVQNRFDRMSKSINSAGASTARALDPIAGQTGNIAAQFQDIVVQLQGGQSPFLIAMQQGTQLSAVLSQSKTPIAALSSAFMQMVNPISLATIAAIALGGAAVQYLGSILGDGKSATEVIKEQNDVIRRVAENWGDAVPALKAYVDQLDRAAAVGDITKAYDISLDQAYDVARQKISDVRAEFAALRVDLQQAGASAQEIDALQRAFDYLQQRVDDSTATSEDLNRVLQLLGQSTVSTTNNMSGFSGALSTVANMLAAAAQQAANLRAERDALLMQGPDATRFYKGQDFAAEQERLNSLTAKGLTLENEIARVKAEADRAGANLGNEQALRIAQARLDAEERRSALATSSKGASKAVSEAGRERQAVVDLIAELEYEFSLLGMTEQQKAISNALRRAGAAATEEQRQAITNLVNATQAEAAAMAATNEQMREFADAGRQALQGYISDMIAGKNATEALGNALGNIGDRLVNLGLDALFGGGSDFGFLGQMFGISGKRAAGGPVSAGQTYLVGEKGPELFTAPMAGKIVANDRLGGAGASVTFAPVIDARGADAASVARLERSMARMAGEMDGRVKQIVRTQGRKWK